MTATKESLADLLNGREYPFEITPQEKRLAKENSLVVVFGASDDLMELEGAISEEYGAYCGGETFITKEGAMPEHDDDCDCKYCGYKEAVKSARKIEALWCPEPNVSWVIKADIPHAEFNIMEDGEVFCRGIVFSMGDV